jgi:Patatin-like phospholipase
MPETVSTESEPTKLDQVLREELHHLGKDEGLPEGADLKKVYAHIGRLKDGNELSALCLSGGGIRSATFNLGVLQALAAFKLLGKFDYLSTVSGGGYISGWFNAWTHRVSPDEVADLLAEPASVPGFRPLAPEPKPLDHLRVYSNYLTPRLGLLSADTWCAAAMIVRNLLLNWLVLIPVLMAIVAIPQATLIVAASSVQDANWGRLALRVAIGIALVTSVLIHGLRRRRANDAIVLGLGVLPLWMSALFLALAALWLPGHFETVPLSAFCVVWCVVIPLVGWIVARPIRSDTVLPPGGSDVAGIILSGVAAGLLLALLVETMLQKLLERPESFVFFTVPILLGLYLLARTLLVAFASAWEGLRGWTGEIATEEREWWARLSGWVLVLSVSWIGVSALVLLGQVLVGLASRWVTLATAGGMTAVTGLLTALLGANSRTNPSSSGPHRAPSPRLEWALRLLAPATVAGIVLLLSMLNVWAGRRLTAEPNLLKFNTKLHLQAPGDVFWLLLTFAIVPVTCALLSWALGWVVNINRFSGQGFYRNRLVRAYLGASNPDRNSGTDPERAPNPFTGFAVNDNLNLHELARDADRKPVRPLPVINVALNLVSSTNLAWQQRKAESFSMTPLYCGNFYEGYRRSRDYGGKGGISLGAAITISGAAANPSSGYHSSPLTAFLMTLFNVRLGAWLGNTNEHGRKVYRYPGPRHAWKPLFADLFGRTNSSGTYVSLSDGGHFENLGVYEMILRRCRLIVASDAGHDPDFGFEDLGNLIRKVRIDFGIPIEFVRPIQILSRSKEGPGFICALARIRYDQVDKGSPPGCLLYLKPTIRASLAVPYDVYSYSCVATSFPHESTSDQFFSEAQFESYRALGRHLAEQLDDKASPPANLAAFFGAIEEGLEMPVDLEADAAF